MLKKFINKYNNYILGAIDLILIAGIVNGFLEIPKPDRLASMCVLVPLSIIFSFILICEIKEDDASSRQIDQLSKEFDRSRHNQDYNSHF